VEQSKARIIPFKRLTIASLDDILMWGKILMILALVVAAKMQPTPHVSKDKEGTRISDSCSPTHRLARTMFVMVYISLWDH
jgi:hypothetical protein